MHSSTLLPLGNLIARQPNLPKSRVSIKRPQKNEVHYNQYILKGVRREFNMRTRRASRVPRFRLSAGFLIGAYRKGAFDTMTSDKVPGTRHWY